MLRLNRDRDPASHVEGSTDPTPVGLKHLHQIIEDGVCEVFLKHALVAVRPQIQLKGFGFDYFLVRDVFDRDGGEVGLLGCGADTGEFVGFQAHHISAFGVMVWKGLQPFAGSRFAAE